MGFRGFTAVVLMTASLLFSTPATPVYSAPNGKTSTAEIVAGVGALYVLSQYFSALSKSKGSSGQAEGIVDATTDGVASKPGVAPVTYAWSLRNIRDLIIYDVASAISGSKTSNKIAVWRQEFEHYRGCWNRILVQPAGAGANSGAGNSSPAKPPTNQSGDSLITLDSSTSAGPANPTTTPKNAAKPCDALFQDFNKSLVSEKGAQPILAFDLTDLTSALSDKSLYQQVLDQDVGSYATDNAIRSLFLTYIGEKLAIDIQTTGLTGAKATGAGVKDYTSAVTNCGIKLAADAFSCIGSLISLQQAFSAQRSQHDACVFSRGVWIPSFTAIKGTVTSVPPLGIDPDTKAPAAFPIVFSVGTNPAILAVDPVRPQHGFPGAPPGC